MGKAGVSVPMFSTPGNHEQEEGWNLDDGRRHGQHPGPQVRSSPPRVPAAASTPPTRDPLSSISAATYGDQYREDYYAWTWGDALFVVIDTFEYTPQNSYGNVAGDGTNDPQTGDQWNWTLGKQQYDWLRPRSKAAPPSTSSSSPIRWWAV